MLDSRQSCAVCFFAQPFARATTTKKADGSPFFSFVFALVADLLLQRFMGLPGAVLPVRNDEAAEGLRLRMMKRVFATFLKTLKGQVSEESKVFFFFLFLFVRLAKALAADMARMGALVKLLLAADEGASFDTCLTEMSNMQEYVATPNPAANPAAIVLMLQRVLQLRPEKERAV